DPQAVGGHTQLHHIVLDGDDGAAQPAGGDDLVSRLQFVEHLLPALLPLLLRKQEEHEHGGDGDDGEEGDQASTCPALLLPQDEYCPGSHSNRYLFPAIADADSTGLSTGWERVEYRRATADSFRI